MQPRDGKTQTRGDSRTLDVSLFVCVGVLVWSGQTRFASSIEYAIPRVAGPRCRHRGDALAVWGNGDLAYTQVPATGSGVPFLTARSPFTSSLGTSRETMEQFKGLWRDTKFVWIGFVAMTLAIAIFGSWYYLLLLPCLPVSFVYFAFIRYDEEGNEKGDFT